MPHRPASLLLSDLLLPIYLRRSPDRQAAFWNQPELLWLTKALLPRPRRCIP